MTPLRLIGAIEEATAVIGAVLTAGPISRLAQYQSKKKICEPAHTSAGEKDLFYSEIERRAHGRTHNVAAEP